MPTYAKSKRTLRIAEIAVDLALPEVVDERYGGWNELLPKKRGERADLLAELDALVAREMKIPEDLLGVPFENNDLRPDFSLVREYWKSAGQ
jgi:hypothetical protein